MIITNKTIGVGRQYGKFSQNKRTLIGSSEGKVYQLKNSLATFTFKRDGSTGLRLDSFNEKDSRVFKNYSKSLWKIGMLREHSYSSSNKKEYKPAYTVYPKLNNLKEEDITLTEDSNAITLQAIWKNVKYDNSNSNKLCNVTFTASLDFSSAQLDMTLSLRDTSGLLENEYIGDILHAVGLPSIATTASIAENNPEEDVLVLGVQLGNCTKNPVKNYEAPRWDNESIQFKYTRPGDVKNHKFYKAGAPGNVPYLSSRLLNITSPGWMYTPLAVMGNRNTKDGFLYYAVDSDGCHAKNFQAYSNGTTLNLRFWDLSDESVNTNGVGGRDDSKAGTYDVDTIPIHRRPRINNIGWSVRIRPFKSPTKWVDWESIYLYKREVIPELENLGWMAKPFYKKYTDNEVSLADIEIPFYANTVGHLSGNADDFNDTLGYYRDWYKSLSNIGYTPRVYGHVQETTINTQPRKNEHFGWETWATGQSGVDAFLSPDAELNQIYSGTVSQGLASGNTSVFYLIFPFVISSGSVWTQEYSGQDFIAKRLQEKDKTFTYDDYSSFANGAIPVDSIFTIGNTYVSCFSPTPSQEKFKEIVSGLASIGAGVYNDTCGLFNTKGCMAESHRFYDPIELKNKIHYHPKAQYSHYFNKKQLDWLESEYSTRLTSLSPASVPDSISPLEFISSSEYSSDVILKYCPSHIPIDFAAGDHLRAYYRTMGTDPRPDFLYEFNLGGFLNAGGVKRPSHNLVIPMFHILYGDRSIATNWVAPTFSNLLDMSGSYIQIGRISGYDEFGTVVNYPLTHEERLQELRHLACTTHNYFNLLSIQHQSKDFEDWDEVNLTLGQNARFSGYPEDHSELLDTPAWSGYKNYTETFLRTQILEPDYLYHGTIQHPFDIYQVDTLPAGFSINAIRDGSPNFLESEDNEEEVIYHCVRRHRSKPSILVTISNWTSGEYRFSGQFDPAAYNFQNAYYVYEIGVTNSDNGLKTQLTYNSINSNYEFNFLMPGASTRVFEIQQEETILTPEFSNFVSNYTNIRYGYSKESLAVNDFGIAYSYGTSCTYTLEDPHRGFKSASTQQIANNLPPWMEIRQNQDSRGWKLINSWGQSFEEVLEFASSRILETSLETADENQIYKVNYFDLKNNEDVKSEYKNFLFNSSFSIKDASRTNLPAGWTDYENPNYNIVLDNIDSFINANSLKFIEKGTITQTLELNRYVDSLTASAYIKSLALDTDVRIIITIELLDGSSIGKEAVIISKSVDWKRLVLPIEVHNDVYRIHFSIRGTKNSNISSPMLETGNEVTKWSCSNLDILPFLPFSMRFDVIKVESTGVNKEKINIFPVNDEQTFMNLKIPTRITSTKSPINNKTDFYKNQLFGRRVSFEGELIPTQWFIQDNKILELSTIPGPYDIFERYDLKELRFTHDLNYGALQNCTVERTLIDCVIKDEILYILCKEVYKGATHYCMKLAFPRTPPGKPYLESFLDFNIDINNDLVYGLNSIKETPTSLVISDSNPDLIGINTNTLNRIYYKLHFDYYFHNSRNGIIYTLEDYNDNNISLL